MFFEIKHLILDAKNASMTCGFAHYEISVALNLDVDDLLVGLIAEIKQSLKSDLFDFSDGIKVCLKTIFQKI